MGAVPPPLTIGETGLKEKRKWVKVIKIQKGCDFADVSDDGNAVSTA